MLINLDIVPNRTIPESAMPCCLQECFDVRVRMRVLQRGRSKSFRDLDRGERHVSARLPPAEEKTKYAQ